MRLLADENIDPALVAWLRTQGNDVLAIRELSCGAEDVDVLALANGQSRVILTRDKDFGELVYRHGLPVPGVVLVRFLASSRAEYLEVFAALWPLLIPHLQGHFIVITNKSLRIRPL